MLSNQQLQKIIASLKNQNPDPKVLQPLLPVLQKLHFLNTIGHVNKLSLLMKMLNNLVYKPLPAGRILIEQGQIGRQLYLMLMGKIAVIKQQQKPDIEKRTKDLFDKATFLYEEKKKDILYQQQAKIVLAYIKALKFNQYNPNKYFTQLGLPLFNIITTFNTTQVTGQLALINQAKRSASIITVQDCQLGVLSKSNFQQIFNQCIKTTKLAYQFIQGYLPKQESSQISMLSILCQSRQYQSLTTLWQQNHNASFLLVICKGDITLSFGQKNQPILTLSDGCFCGDQDINIKRWQQNSTRRCRAKTTIYFKDLYGCFKKRSTIGRFFQNRAKQKIQLIQQCKSRFKIKQEDSSDSINTTSKRLKLKRKNKLTIKPIEIKQSDYFGILKGTYHHINQLQKQIKQLQRNNRWNKSQDKVIRRRPHTQFKLERTKQAKIYRRLNSCLIINGVNK